MEPLISVIVPIYNVEKYVKKCLDSLCAQTMKQIEVICIDDGSTDKSGIIADEYASDEFPIFRVIHTENRGLSAARNRGVDESRSQWLMFVDSDDWVDERFCERPYKAVKEHDADMVVFSEIQSTEKGRLKHFKREQSTNRYTKPETLIDDGNTVVWNKLYKKDLFKDIRYPEGHVYEDVATTHKLIYKAKRVYVCSDRLYYYRRRKGSISRSTEYRADEYRARVRQSKELLDLGYAKSKSDQLLWAASIAYCGHASDKEDPLYKEAEEILRTIPGKPRTWKQKAMAAIWMLNKDAFRSIYQILGKRMN